MELSNDEMEREVVGRLLPFLVEICRTIVYFQVLKMIVLSGILNPRR